MAPTDTKASRRTSATTRGTTLIELLAASAVFMIGFTGVMLMVAHASTMSKRSKKAMLAQELVTDLAAQIGSWTYNDARLALTSAEPCLSHPSDDLNYLYGQTTTGFGAFTACAFSEADLTQYTGIQNTDTNYAGVSRHFVVQEFAKNSGVPLAVVNSGAVKRIWIFATYSWGEGGMGGRASAVVAKYNPSTL